MAERRRLLALAGLALAACLEFPSAAPDAGVGGTGGQGAAGGGPTGGRGGDGGAAVGGEAGGGTLPGGQGGGGAAGGEASGGQGGDGGAGGAPPPDPWDTVVAGGDASDAARSTTYLPRFSIGHTCALTRSGRLFCWGANFSGQVGAADEALRYTRPVEVEPAFRWLSVSAGLAHTCAIRRVNDGDTAGPVYCWGEPSAGRLGREATEAEGMRPQPIVDASDFRTVAAGGGHTCGLKTNGTLHCWGAAGYGQLGDGMERPRAIQPQPVDGTWDAVATGLTHTCALSNGELYCWGGAERGQTGAIGGSAICSFDLQNTVPCDPTPRLVSGGASWVSVAVGAGHTCVQDATGNLSCLGDNSYFQLGTDADLCDDGSGTCGATVEGQPVAAGVSAYGVGGFATCFVGDAGLKCLGDATFGQRGNGYPDAEDRLIEPYPADLPVGTRVTSVAASGGHTCVVTAEGRMYCFGNNADGQVGNGEASSALAPVRIDLPGRVLDLSAGNSGTTCAVVSTDGDAATRGDVYCWGDASSGLLLNLANGHADAPVQLTQTGDFTTVSVGFRFACAVQRFGPAPGGQRVVCWGANDRGQLGDPSPTDHVGEMVTVYEIDGTDRQLRVSAGAGHACLWSDTTGLEMSAIGTQCWGENAAGQLGVNGPQGDGPSAPVAVAMPGQLVSLAVNDSWTLSVNASGELVFLGGLPGFWQGELNDQPEVYLVPRAVSMMNGWRSVAARVDAVCGLLAVRGVEELYCGNVPGESSPPVLTSARFTAYQLPSADDRWRGYAVGQDAHCAVTEGGFVACAGDNRWGQLGDGTRDAEYDTRMRRVNQGDVRFGPLLTLGDRTTCAVAEPVGAAEPGIYCWGHGSRGELGTGVADATVPVEVSAQ